MLVRVGRWLACLVPALNCAGRYSGCPVRRMGRSLGALACLLSSPIGSNRSLGCFLKSAGLSGSVAGLSRQTIPLAPAGVWLVPSGSGLVPSCVWFVWSCAGFFGRARLRQHDLDGRPGTGTVEHCAGARWSFRAQIPTGILHRSARAPPPAPPIRCATH
jgi:hypothetical protein